MSTRIDPDDCAAGHASSRCRTRRRRSRRGRRRGRRRPRRRATDNSLNLLRPDAARQPAGAAGHAAAAVRLGRLVGDHLPQEARARPRRHAKPTTSRSASGPAPTCPSSMPAPPSATAIVGGLEAIFEAGFREFGRLRQRRGADSRMQLEGAQRAMRATGSREIDGLEHNLEFLANVGSISPVRRPVRHGVGHHDFVPRPGQHEGSDHRHRRAGHLRGADRHRDGPVRRDPGGVGLQPLRRPRSNASRVRYDTFAEEFSSILQRQAHLDEP